MNPPRNYREISWQYQYIQQEKKIIIRFRSEEVMFKAKINYFYQLLKVNAQLL